MATEKYNGFEITTEDTSFKPIEFTVKITSRELYNQLVATMNAAHNEGETVAYIAYERDDSSVNEFITTLFTTITK